MPSCLIIDDEPLAIELLSDYVQRTEGLEIAATFTDPIKALHYLREHTVDGIFLDVQMPELNGIQFLKIVGDQTSIVLTTAYEQYAIEGYELNVVDYLLKPISFERFGKAVTKLFPTEQSSSSREESGKEKALDYLFVKSGYQTLRIDLDELLYLSGSGDYATLFLSNGRKVLTLEKLSDFVARLPGQRFTRIHRSYIVSLDKIDYIEKQRVVIGEERLPISDSYREAFWQLLA
ncbi:MAG: LytTR family DNA-binding domain-containing protein [Bacteroidota bacterium]